MADIAKIKEIITADMYGMWGLRALHDDEDYAVGDEPRESYDWDHEKDISTYHTNGSTIGGVCTTGICTLYDDEIEQNIRTALERVARYGSKRFALIHANGGYYGEDDGEYILCGNTEVMAVWEVA